MELTTEQIKTLKALAIDSAEKNNLPNAALAIKNGKTVESAGSYPASTPDATMHSERALVTKLCKKENKFLLPTGYSVVSVVEPCLMCIGAAYWAGIKKIYYIIPASKYAKKIPWMTESNTLNKLELVKQLNEKMELIHLPEYEDEFKKLFEMYVKKTVKRK
jgi:tRNA(Arg) A34 adenosine deaminase TadA